MPKRVLEIMNVQGLTRENVASHLQKYRLYLKRLSGLESTPSPIVSFQVWKDGAPGGVMHQVPGRNPSSITSGIKGLNLGAGLGVGLCAEKSLNPEMKKSLQFKMQKQQRAANWAQVLGALGLVDYKPHHHQSTSSIGGGGLQRMCSLDLQYFSEEELTTPSPSSSVITNLCMNNNNKKKKKKRGGDDNDDRVGESGEGPKSHANWWIERTYSGPQIEELNIIRGRVLQGSLEKQSASEVAKKMEPIQEMAPAPELPPLPPPKSADSCSSLNHFPDLIRVLAANNPWDEALSDFAPPPILPGASSEIRLETVLNVSDYPIDDDDLLEHWFNLHLLPE